MIDNIKRIYRSTTDKKISGLCGGIAKFVNVDPTIIRLVAVFIAFFSLGWFIFFYLIGWLLVPEEPFN